MKYAFLGSLLDEAIINAMLDERFTRMLVEGEGGMPHMLVLTAEPDIMVGAMMVMFLIFTTLTSDMDGLPIVRLKLRSLPHGDLGLFTFGVLFRRRSSGDGTTER